MNRDWSDNADLVVVTGIGLVSPLGAGREATWSRLVAGETAVQNWDGRLEARVVDFSANGARSRMGDFALLSAREALVQAGLLDPQSRGPMRIGCCVSQSKPMVDSLDPHLVMSGFFGWSADALLPKYFSLNGPVSNVVAACATGLASLKMAEQWLAADDCDVVLAGAAESSLNDFYRAGFRQMGVLAEGPNPSAVRPFDAGRSGFAMGEGAAVLVLEKASHARKRNQAPLAVLDRVVLQQSPQDVLRFDEDGASVERLLKAVMKNKARPGCINAHGTGTRVNDAAEAKGIRTVFGNEAGSIPVSSTKAATGHLLGAAGALEAALAVLSLRDGRVPPTLHLENQDPVCDVDVVSGRARTVAMDSALSLSYGFGGQMGAVLFRKIN